MKVGLRILFCQFAQLRSPSPHLQYTIGRPPALWLGRVRRVSGLSSICRKKERGHWCSRAKGLLQLQDSSSQLLLHNQ